MMNSKAAIAKEHFRAKALNKKKAGEINEHIARLKRTLAFENDQLDMRKNWGVNS